jgi:antitoxin component YwqK of YwqJK toxin-antitoxin module
MGSNKSIADTKTIHCDSLSLINDTLSVDGLPYTGTCYLNYPNSNQKYIEKQLLDGILNGSIFYYDQSGNVILEEFYEKGVKKGTKNEILVVNCKDLKIKEIEEEPIYYYNDVKFTGTCHDYYPNSEQVYIEKHYKDGMLNGYTTYFNKDGSVLMMSKFEDNKLISEVTAGGLGENN